MRTDFIVSLNNVNLHDIDPNIYIEDINEEPSIDVQEENRGSYGQTVVNTPERSNVVITIRFKVKEPDRAKNNAIISKIKGWAKSGWLRTNMREGQRIYVICTKPVSNSALETYKSKEMTFTAYNESYWQEDTPVALTLTGTYDSGTIKPNGTRQCFLEAEITNTSGSTVTNVRITARNQTLEFSEISLANNAKLTISYEDERHIMLAKIGNTSVLGKRTEASSDHIIIPNGVNTTVTFVASGVCSAVIKARGLFD